MALARVTTWSAAQVLTASALNGEFNNILNNALSLISPLTGNLDFNGNSLLNLAVGSVTAPGWSFNGDSNTGDFWVSADIIARVAGGVEAMRWITTASAVNSVQITPAATTFGPLIDVRGTDTNISMFLAGKGTGNVAINTGFALVPAALSGTMAQHGLYQANVCKAWLQMDGTGTAAITVSFNVTSITDEGVGDFTVTWTRVFATANYPVAAMGGSPGTGFALLSTGSTSVVAAGTFRFGTFDSGFNLADRTRLMLVALGGQ